MRGRENPARDEANFYFRGGNQREEKLRTASAHQELLDSVHECFHWMSRIYPPDVFHGRIGKSGVVANHRHTRSRARHPRAELSNAPAAQAKTNVADLAKQKAMP